MEFCHQGALQQLLEMRREANAILEESAIWNIFWQVVVAVHEIHNDKKGVLVHRNIKPESILLGADDCVKLGNFGVAKRLESEDHYAQTNIQGGRYTSPEQLTQGIFTTQTDIWALGCLLY
jgi:serine/threonine protein kinase